VIGLSHEDIADLGRWTLSGVIVILAYGGIATAMVNWRDPIEPAEIAAAMVVDFAPVPVAPAVPQTDIAPGPEMVMSNSSPDVPAPTPEEKPEEKVEPKVEAKIQQKVDEKTPPSPVEEPPPEVPPAPNPAVAVEPPPPTQVVKEAKLNPQSPQLPAPTTSAPQAIPAEIGPVPAAPTQGQPNPNGSQAMVTWKMQILALLERNKRYPAEAQSRHQQGIAHVVFSLDRLGRLVESRLLRSSGAAALDEEALALLRRAQPFPMPPTELGDSAKLNVPIRFNLR
jgi:periplasmic protein TonB